MSSLALFIPMIARVTAGFLSVYVAKSLTRRDGAQSGVIVGAISGGITLIGLLIGGVLLLSYIHMTGTWMLIPRFPRPLHRFIF